MLTEEAQTLIREEANKEFSARMSRIATIIGVTNIVAVVGLYSAVLFTASKVATTAADKAVEDAFKNNEKLIKNIEDRTTQLSSKLDDEIGRLGRQTAQLDSLQGKIANLEELVGTTDKADAKRISQIIRELRESPGTEELLENFVKLNLEVKAIEVRLQDSSVVGTPVPMTPYETHIADTDGVVIATSRGKNVPFEEIKIEYTPPGGNAILVRSFSKNAVYGTCTAIIPKGSTWSVRTVTEDNTAMESVPHTTVYFTPIRVALAPTE